MLHYDTEAKNNHETGSKSEEIKNPAKQRTINAKINQLNIIPGLFWLRKKTDLRFLGVGGGGDRSSFRHGEQQDSLLYLVHTIISNEMKSSRARCRDKSERNTRNTARCRR
jgi:hypothetical protein